MKNFANRLMLEASVEAVPENLSIPERWRANASHFRMLLWRPGARETHYQFSVQGTVEQPDVLGCLSAMSEAMNFYETHPTLEQWCAATGADPAEIADSFNSFAQDRRALIQFFGEDYEDFLHAD